MRNSIIRNCKIEEVLIENINGEVAVSGYEKFKHKQVNYGE